jgi:HPt (histidine-containing phosphotransfer) domain-containing protein
LIGTFSRDCQGNLALLRTAVSERKFRLFRDAVHALRGFAATFGALRLATLLEQAPNSEETFAKRGLASVTAVGKTIEDTTVALEAWLRAQNNSGQHVLPSDQS